MDPVTQGLLGAVVATAAAPRLGRRAMVCGALFGMLPDVDIFLAPMGTFEGMRSHRGFTHSLWFPLLGIPCGLLLARFHAYRLGLRGAGFAPGSAESKRHRADWCVALFTAILSHPLLDLFTTYGTQLFAPFSYRRFAIDAMPIIDPAYSLLLFGALGFAFVARIGVGKLGVGKLGVGKPGVGKLGVGKLGVGKLGVGKLRGIMLGALMISSAYIALGAAQNQTVQARARRDLAARGITDAEVHAFPTMFQIPLRRVVAWRKGEVAVAFVSTIRDDPIRWHRHAVADDHPAVRALRASPRGELFEWFAMDRTGAFVEPDPEREGGVVVQIDDLRYGYGRPAVRGLWGITARFDAAGEQVGLVKRFRHPRDAPLRDGVRRLWRALWGLQDLADPLPRRSGARAPAAPDRE